MKIPLSYSFRNLWTRRLTSALTIGGIALVVFVFTAVLMLARGVQQTLTATGRDDNAILVRKSANTEMMSVVSRESASIVRAYPEVATLPSGAPLASSEVSVIINLLKKGTSDMGNVIVRGVGAEAFALRPQLQLTSGRMFRVGLSEVIVGSAIHDRFQGCRIGEQLRFGGRWWTIVGFFTSGGSGFDSEIWGDAEQLMPSFGRPVYSAMTLRLRDIGALDALQARMARDPRLLDLDLVRERQFYEAQSESMALFIRILGITITIVFSIGAIIGAMITMYASVANRTSEIGTLRALGFPRASILIAFLAESLFIALLGGALGVASASLLNFFSVSTVNWGSFSELAFGFDLSPDIAVTSLLFALGMGVTGGFLPAVRAARMNILTALRSS